MFGTQRDRKAGCEDAISIDMDGRWASCLSAPRSITHVQRVQLYVIPGLDLL
jgi:hypothetical protein